MHAWFLCTEKRLLSRDSRRHVDWLLEKLNGKEEILRSLRADGAKADVFCYWLSKSGHGGPVLSPRQMETLARLGLDCGYDCYYFEDDGNEVEPNHVSRPRESTENS